jgi:hypothetical protein
MIHPRILDTMVQGALVALVWSELAEDGSPLDSAYTVDDIDPADRDTFAEAVESFALANIGDTFAMMRHYNADQFGYSASLFGHDFTLTSNRHGAGFWDRGEDTGAADRLTEAAHAATWNLYVGDDGSLHIY